MIKNNKIKLIISSIIILLPILAGFVLWDKLPDKMIIHWGIDGKADGYASKPFAVIFLPVFLLAMHWICMLGTSLDPRNKNQSKKVFGMIFWICPIISLVTNGVVYLASFDREFDPSKTIMIIIGITFILIGNYLPKCKHNYTIGIKISWTLHSEKNWNATHRFSGKLYVIGGFLILASAFLPVKIAFGVMFAVFVAMMVIPIVYSYSYHKKFDL